MTPIASAPVREDEIDLRRYVSVLLRRWKMIGALTILTLLVSALVTRLTFSPTYTATASVVISVTRDQLNFDPKFKTEYQIPYDPTPRKAALVRLASSSAIAAQVISKLGDALAPAYRSPSALLDLVNVTSQGDLIEMNVTTDTADQAAMIANAWVDLFAVQANQVFNLAGKAPSEIKPQVDAAWGNYQTAQAQYEQFVANNNLSLLEQQVKLKQTQFADRYSTLSRLNRIISDAESLRDQLRQGTDTSINNRALLLLLQLNAFSASSGLAAGERAAGEAIAFPLQFPLDTTVAGREPVTIQAREVEAILTVLETRRQDLQAQIDSADVKQELSKLQEAQEQEMARHRSLSQARDVAWDTYTTLLRKQAEVGVASQLPDTQVRVAAAAIPPEKPSQPRTMRNLLLGGLAGVLLGVVGALGLEFMGAVKRSGTQLGSTVN
ncbi:MAG: hypothetical protein KIT87_12975 [Anaerolineae bacterium]|nr:hypothetical protein [Anaerolineae bacterium]